VGSCSGMGSGCDNDSATGGSSGTEVRGEAQKGQPNKTKLKALVSGVTSGVLTVIQTLGCARVSYENIVGAVKGPGYLFWLCRDGGCGFHGGCATSYWLRPAVPGAG
jgi:hypothetical protein